MKIRVVIKRQECAGSEPYLQTIPYECDPDESVSMVLDNLNSTTDLRDEKGERVKKIVWESSCGQKKCGACAMLINDVPRLACNSFVRDIVGEAKLLSLKPLSKFSVVADLVVDRSIIHEKMKEMKLWLEKHEEAEEQNLLRYKSAKCLMCGCCLEICPNYAGDGKFSGAAVVPNTFQILKRKDLVAHKKEIAKEYKKVFYERCGVSLSCQTVCPAKVPMEELLVKMNSILFGEMVNGLQTKKEKGVF